MANDVTVKVYCGTYHKYNSASLFGEWVTLNDYADKEELYDYFKELHKDEEDPEFMFQDIEGPDLITKYYLSESGIHDNIYDAIEALENATYDLDMYDAYTDIDTVDPDDPMQDFINNAEEAYCGEFESDADFAENYAEETGAINKELSWPYNCIDWERAARDLMMDHHECDGYYFRNY